eukprot:3932863-Rhodomonas_salina.1
MLVRTRQAHRAGPRRGSPAFFAVLPRRASRTRIARVRPPVVLVRVPTTAHARPRVGPTAKPSLLPRLTGFTRLAHPIPVD